MSLLSLFLGGSLAIGSFGGWRERRRRARAASVSCVMLCAMMIAQTACGDDSSGNRFGDAFYKTVEVADTEISPRRLDLALESMLTGLPPLVLHGSLYGECPLYAVEGTPLAVFCLGFWSHVPVPWHKSDDKADRVIEIVYAGKARCEALPFHVRWDDDAVRFEGYFDGRPWAEPPDDETRDYCRRLTLSVLDRCTAKEWRADTHVVDRAAIKRRYLDRLLMRSKEKTPLVRMAEIEVYPEWLGTYLAAARTVGAESVAKEEGVICIFPMQRKDSPATVRIVEVYRDEAAYKAHLETPHFRAYKTATPHMIKSLALVPMQPLDAAHMNLIFRKERK